MPDVSFARLRAKPFPQHPSRALQLALADYAIDADMCAEDPSQKVSVDTADDGELLLSLSYPFARDGIEYYRRLIVALVADGAHVYAYCDPGVEYPDQGRVPRSRRTRRVALLGRG
jgi:hypothetical protein